MSGCVRIEKVRGSIPLSSTWADREIDSCRTLSVPALRSLYVSAQYFALYFAYRDEFDRDCQEALAEAGQSLDLEGVFDVLEHWRMRSWITRDKREHRRVVRRAVELLTGQQPPADEPVAVTEARL